LNPSAESRNQEDFFCRDTAAGCVICSHGIGCLLRMQAFNAARVPVDVSARGRPAEGYPCDWSIYRWLFREPAAAASIRT
jgi:hypothetical protein